MATSPAVPGTKIFGMSPTLVGALGGTAIGLAASALTKTPMWSTKSIMITGAGLLIGAASGYGYEKVKEDQAALPPA